MFLTDLQEKLRDVQTERGNIPLSSAHVMHEHTVLVAHNTGDASETENPRKLQTIAEAEGVSGTLEERLRAAGPGGIVSVTSDELQQLIEYEAELKSSYNTGALGSRRVVEGNAGAPPSKGPGEPGKIFTAASAGDTPSKPVEIDALKAHEENQARLEAARADITRANAVEGDQPDARTKVPRFTPYLKDFTPYLKDAKQPQE
jgi:hypothetical protein